MVYSHHVEWSGIKDWVLKRLGFPKTNLCIEKLDPLLVPLLISLVYDGHRKESFYLGSFMKKDSTLHLRYQVKEEIP